MSNTMLQHWCTRGQTEVNDKGFTYPSLHISTKSTRIIKRAKFGNSFPKLAKIAKPNSRRLGKSAQGRENQTLGIYVFLWAQV
ncbi:hypothetical protein GQ457_05G023230 [Hibiscus cannabinus]